MYLSPRVWAPGEFEPVTGHVRGQIGDRCGGRIVPPGIAAVRGLAPHANPRLATALHRGDVTCYIARRAASQLIGIPARASQCVALRPGARLICRQTGHWTFIAGWLIAACWHASHPRREIAFTPCRRPRHCHRDGAAALLGFRAPRASAWLQPGHAWRGRVNFAAYSPRTSRPAAWHGTGRAAGPPHSGARPAHGRCQRCRGPLPFSRQPSYDAGADLGFRVAGPGFEPGKAKPTVLQTAPFGRSGNLPCAAPWTAQ